MSKNKKFILIAILIVGAIYAIIGIILGIVFTRPKETTESFIKKQLVFIKQTTDTIVFKEGILYTDKKNTFFELKYMVIEDNNNTIHTSYIVNKFSKEFRYGHNLKCDFFKNDSFKIEFEHAKMNYINKKTYTSSQLNKIFKEK